MTAVVPTSPRPVGNVVAVATKRIAARARQNASLAPTEAQRRRSLLPEVGSALYSFRSALKYFRRLEVKKLLLQINLNSFEATQDLLIQRVKERLMDLLLFSEQYRDPDSLHWYLNASRRAGIQLCDPVLRIYKFLKTEKKLFLWTRG